MMRTRERVGRFPPSGPGEPSPAIGRVSSSRYLSMGRGSSSRRLSLLGYHRRQVTWNEPLRSRRVSVLDWRFQTTKYLYFNIRVGFGYMKSIPRLHARVSALADVQLWSEEQEGREGRREGRGAQHLPWHAGRTRYPDTARARPCLGIALPCRLPRPLQ